MGNANSSGRNYWWKLSYVLPDEGYSFDKNSETGTKSYSPFSGSKDRDQFIRMRHT